MRRALELAWRGWGRVSPNPMVGAVVLRGDETVAEGWHAEFGGPHAELAALHAAGDKARGATLVVTLEPCAHHGKTPPCTDAIRAAGIRRVVAAVRDPDAEARGGVEVLKRAGIETRGISDHGFIDSIYFRDPNGYVIELTAKRENHEREMDPRANDARRKLAEWQKNRDQSPN